MASYVKKGKSYLLTVYDGYDDRYKQIRHRKTWKPDDSLKNEEEIQKELKRVMQEFEDRIKGKRVVKSGSVKFCKVINEYYENLIEKANQGMLSEMTVDRYLEEKERLNNVFGHKKIESITCYQIQDFLKSLNSMGANKNTGGALSCKSQKQILNILSNVFKYAIENNYDIRDNPCRDIVIKSTKKNPPKIITYSDEEFTLFMNCLRKAPLKYQLFYTMLATLGLRTEEILGLKWECIDFEKNTAKIENAVSHSRRKGNIEHCLKTKSSYRYNPLSSDVVSLLKCYKAQQEQDIEAMGDKWIPSSYVFTGVYGGPMGYNTARHWLKKFCEKEGIRYVSPHCFRHFTVTRLINAGTPINVISELVGHSNLSTTTDIYYDAMMKRNAESEAMRNAVNNMGIHFDFDK